MVASVKDKAITPLDISPPLSAKVLRSAKVSLPASICFLHLGSDLYTQNILECVPRHNSQAGIA